MASYDGWWRLSPENRTAEWLTSVTAWRLQRQWKRLHEGRDRVSDADLFARRGDRPIHTACSAGIASPLHHFGPLDDLPPPAIADASLRFSLAPPRSGFYLKTREIVGSLYHVSTSVGFADQRAWPTDRSPALWLEGSPRERFGYGVALMLRDLAGACAARELATVGDVRLRIKLEPFSDVMAVDLAAYGLDADPSRPECA